jgi:NADPH:quinone reductase
LGLEQFALRGLRRGKARVRVTHVAVGSTDVMARAGDYLLQPRPGFVPGYDFVGIVDEVNGAGTRQGLRTGMRVTGCLARMGSYTTHLNVPIGRLVQLPVALDSASAAALPLDLITAAFARELAELPSGGTLFVNGVSGSVGSIIAQQAVADGLKVIGTASERTRHHAESLGVRVVDYRDPHWPVQVQELSSGGVDTSIDHTGSPSLRSITKREGIVVRTAWSNRPGHGRRDAALGGPLTIARRFASPREALCSVPLLVALQPAKYRRILANQLDRIVDGHLRCPTVTVRPFAEAAEAHREFSSLPPGQKLILELGPND